MPKLKVGDPAPDFTATDAQGQTFRLSDFRGRTNVVLYFYPKDFTPGCTREACAFRDRYEALRGFECEVIGVSGDTVESHRRFSESHRLPFRLVSDRDKRIRKAYGVGSSFGILPGRVTYVIDKEGVIRHIFSSQLKPVQHVEEAIRALRRLKPPSEGGS